MHYSPLRYPWWKNKLAKFLASICIENKINSHYVEPYSGWAWIALFLLLEWHVEKITINDLDRSIYAFWYCVLNETERFCRKIEKEKLDIETWKKHKDIQKKKDYVDLFKLWFSTFYLNRTNRSWIIKAGVMWWLEQKGNYKMDCRFNKKDLISRIKKIAEHKDNISLCNLDAIELIKKIEKENKSFWSIFKRNKSKTIFYFDPPYYIHGKSLYVNHYNHEDHKDVSDAICNIKNSHWIVSYDNVPEIEEMYWEDFRPHKYSFKHTAYQSREWKEILFFSRLLNLGDFKDPLKVSL